MSGISRGLRALLLVASSSALGLGYFAYLTVDSFPPDVMRMIPVAWLAGLVVGAIQAVRALREGDQRMAAGLALALSIPSAILAVVFVTAALAGD